MYKYFDKVTVFLAERHIHSISYFC